MDLVEPSSLEETNREAPPPGDSTEPALPVSDLQLTQISSVHQKLYKHLVHTDWYQPESAESLLTSDWIKPILYSFTAASSLSRCLAGVLGKSIINIYKKRMKVSP